MRFLHAMIRVRDLEESTRFYRDFLGLNPSRKLRLDDCTLYYFKDEKSGVEIELTHNDETPKDGYVEGNAFGHFAFETNMGEAINKVEKMGYKWVYEPFLMDEIGKRIAFIADPDGNSIELIEE